MPEELLRKTNTPVGDWMDAKIAPRGDRGNDTFEWDVRVRQGFKNGPARSQQNFLDGRIVRQIDA